MFAPDKARIEHHVFRRTKSICHVCLRDVPAELVVKNDKVFMLKYCPEHGDMEVFLSAMPDYFQELSDAYYTIVPENLPVRILEIVLTPRCSMNCPICSVMSTVGNASSDMSLDDIEKIIMANKRKEFILWGMEPTEHPLIEKVLELFKKHKKTAMLFTNGQKIADIDFLCKLKKAGLKHVYLQFDGFNDQTYEKLRSASLIENKIKALENLKELNISTTLNVTLAKGINEQEILSIIKYAEENSFIRQIGFLPLIKVGKADEFNECSIPHCHEFLKIIEDQTKGLIKVDDLRMFQKLMYVVYRFARFRRCFWFTMFMLVWDSHERRYKSIADFIDLPKVEKMVDGYIHQLKTGAGKFRQAIHLVKIMRALISLKSIKFCFKALRFFFRREKDRKCPAGTGDAVCYLHGLLRLL